MKAILTKFHGATNTKPSRYSAKAEGVPRIMVTDGQADWKACHEVAAHMLAAKYKWLDDGSRLVGGALPDGSMAWVFVPPTPSETIQRIESARERFQAGGRGGAAGTTK